MGGGALNKYIISNIFADFVSLFFNTSTLALIFPPFIFHPPLFHFVGGNIDFFLIPSALKPSKVNSQNISKNHFFACIYLLTSSSK